MEHISNRWNGEDTTVNQIKSALVQALRDLNPPTEPGQIHPPVRASLLNRIVRVPQGADASRAMGALEELADIRPSRTLVVTVDPAAPSGLDATTTVRCRLRSAAQPQVCFEEVEITVRGDLAHHLSSVVEPLLIPEMPVVLWWFGPLPSAEEELLELCDRVVLDSDPAGPEGLPALNRLVETLGPGKIVTDLAWAELSSWRELLAQLFDPVEVRPFQRELKALRLEYVVGAVTTRPLLLVSWLATSLRWTPEGPAGRPPSGMPALRFRTPQGPAEAQIVAVPAVGALQTGELLRVTLQTAEGDAEASFSIARHGEGSCAAVRTTLPGRPEHERVVPLARPSWASLLTGELDRRRADPAYRASLSLAARCAAQR
ncbi:MAG: glucose-6-phosphate dehydrogenase assembly protein OpcA [Chloroflexota bacterium]